MSGHFWSHNFIFSALTIHKIILKHLIIVICNGNFVFNYSLLFEILSISKIFSIAQDFQHSNCSYYISNTSAFKYDDLTISSLFVSWVLILQFKNLKTLQSDEIVWHMSVIYLTATHLPLEKVMKQVKLKKSVSYV